MICLGTATDSITLWRAGSSQIADFHRVQLNITLLPKPQIKSIPFNVISAKSQELTAKELHIDYATSILMKTTLKQHPESNVFLNSIKFHYQRLSIYFFHKVSYSQVFLQVPGQPRHLLAHTTNTHREKYPHAHTYSSTFAPLSISLGKKKYKGDWICFSGSSPQGNCAWYIVFRLSARQELIKAADGSTVIHAAL